MDVFCDKCNKTVGRVDDRKIIPGRRLTVTCPHCGEKVALGSDAVTPELEPVAAADSAPGVAAPVAGVPPRGAAGSYLSIGRILDESWRRTRGLKGPVWGAYLLILLVIGVFNGLVGMTVGAMGHGAVAVGFAVAAQISVSLLFYPFMAGIMMMGVYRAVDLPVSCKMAFGFLGFVVPVLLASFLVGVFTVIGFMLLVIPGIYLSVAYLCVLPLIIDKKMGVWEAMETSRKGVSEHWFTVFLVYLIIGFIVMISAIPMGIGLIWTVPMMVAAGGIVYRDIFGVDETR